VKEREEQLSEQTEHARAQYGDFLKNRTAFDADKAVFDRQKVLWEREKASFLQNARTQRVAASATENGGVTRVAASNTTAVNTTSDAKSMAASVATSEERQVNKMVGGSEEGVVASKSSPSLSAIDSGELGSKSRNIRSD
jgi:hypothetical protein